MVDRSAGDRIYPARLGARDWPDLPHSLERAMKNAHLAAYPALRLRRLRQADWVRRLVRESVLTPPT